ncbi:maleylacetoacetate isomerase [Cyphellophora europaea CBS 101466]|uniref:Maleylacetoacetate isomerase n=1 Tax=Cyphellophora europaea (strain CBS 101466) TaxID=1220924 RepID=W2RL06_CYPE1|nr:maleylacetoacetate isomerase [Cyphellophora europaea CBS 101466]ETN36399.1 maleylacetoacetate isomerase [Cyphellophora europaea CBS 101466]
MATPHPKHTYTLYTFFGSSCSARVRIACHLKSIPLTYQFIDLLTSGQNAPAYAALNPSQFVPLLVVHDATTGAEVAKISQSVAILEFLEETATGVFNDVRLLPPSTESVARAKVRELLGVIVADTQPVTNQRVVKWIVPRGVDELEWQGHFMRKGLEAYEKLARGCAGKWSVGDEISLADVALVAAVDRALRYKVDVQREFPTVARIDEAMRETEAYKRGGFRSQPDTPEGMRGEVRL